MTPEDRKLLQQLRDALVRSNNALNVLTATNHQHDAEIIAAADARLAAPVQSHEAWAAPEGFALVPLEPTPEMLRPFIGCQSDEPCYELDLNMAYQAMLMIAAAQATVKHE